MSQPSNGITPEIIRQIRPPSQLSPDLLQATLDALPRPPQDATPAWREARIARVTQEISALMPANAEQARIATEVLIFREVANMLVNQILAPGIELPLMCRLSRAATTLMQTAVMLKRSLTQDQQKPAPFFGTVLSDQVDIQAANATWHTNPDHHPQPARAPAPDAPPARRPPDPPNPSPPALPAPPSTTLTPTEPQPSPAPPPHPQPPPGQPTDTTLEWSFTKIDEGPGWSREVLRHRSSQEGGNGSAP